MVILAPTRYRQKHCRGITKSQFGLEVVELKLSDIFTFANPLADISDEVNYLFAVGAVLRTEEKSA